LNEVGSRSSVAIAVEQASHVQITTQAPGIFVLNPDDGIKRGDDKSIYGVDNRYEYFKIPLTQMSDNARGVATISEFDQRAIPLRGLCTAFLVAPDVVLTAGHCEDGSLAGTAVRNQAIRFQDYFEAPGQVPQVVDYPAEEMIAWNRQYDFALVRVSKRSDGSLPGDKFPILKLQSGRHLVLGDSVYMIGNPGRDQQYTETCNVVREAYDRNGKRTFGVDCDAFGGNSGSPVFDSITHNVVGIFWGGQSGNRTFAAATNDVHEYVVPLWELSQDNAVKGKWPKGIGFVEQ